MTGIVQAGNESIISSTTLARLDMIQSEWDPLSKAEIHRLYHCAHPQAGTRQADVIFEGPKMFQEALRFPQLIKAVYAREPTDIAGLPMTIKKYVVSESQVKYVTKLDRFPGIACRLELGYAQSLLSSECSLLLHGIQDPGNAGTIIRCAHWYGITKVIANSTVSLFNSKLIQASMGSVLHVGVIKDADIPSLGRTHHFYVSDLKGLPVEETTIRFPWILCIGNESRGIQGLDVVEEAIKVTIPRVGKDIDSLNAAVSCGIILDRFRSLGISNIRK